MTDRYEAEEPIIVIGQTGDTGGDGKPGAKGDTGESSKEEITVLVTAITQLTTEMSELAASMRDLATKFEGNSEATIERVRSAVRLNKLSTAIGVFVLGAVVAMVLVVLNVQGEVSQIHSTQRTNTGITKTDNSILQAVQDEEQAISRATNPAAAKASNDHVVALLNQATACIENHGDRAREVIAHLPVKPLLAGCAANGT